MNLFQATRVVCFASTVFLLAAYPNPAGAQIPQTGGTGGTNTGGGQATGTGQAATGGAGFLTPDAAFSSGIDRSGAIGQSLAPAVGTAPGTEETTGAGGRAAGGLGGGFGGGLGAAFGNLFGNAGANQGAAAVPALRTRLRNAVTGPGLSSPQIATSANITLQTARSLNNPYSGVNVSVENRTAVLSGQVNSESDRRMSHLLMRLQPGVSRVENRLIVSP